MGQKVEETAKGKVLEACVVHRLGTLALTETSREAIRSRDQLGLENM